MRCLHRHWQVELRVLASIPCIPWCPFPGIRAATTSGAINGTRLTDSDLGYLVAAVGEMAATSGFRNVFPVGFDVIGPSRRPLLSLSRQAMQRSRVLEAATKAAGGLRLITNLDVVTRLRPILMEAVQ